MAYLQPLAIGVATVAGLYAARKLFFAGTFYHGTQRIDGKTVLITGANTGIGLETAKDLAKRGGRILMACRNMEKAVKAKEEVVKESGNDDVVIKELDLSSFESIRNLAADINKTEPRLDILINNAGVMVCPQSKTKDGHEMQFGTNHLGHFLLTNLLLEKIKASAPSRIVIVASVAAEMGLKNIQFEDLNFEKNYQRWNVYCQSKLANVIFSSELARRLEGSGVTTYSLHPGGVDTELQRHVPVVGENSSVSRIARIPMRYFFKTPKGGAQTQIRCAVDPDLANESGKYYDNCKQVELKVPIARDEGVAKKLWEVSEKLTGMA